MTQIVPTAAEQTESFAHLNKYELIKPWEGEESRLFAVNQYDHITVGQVLDGDLQLVTLTHADLDEMLWKDGGDLRDHIGTWAATGETRMALSGWDGGVSHEIRVTQKKFKHTHEIVLTRVDAAELLAWFPESETDD